MAHGNNQIDDSKPGTPSPAEIQRRLHGSRESIANTVEEMRTTMHNEYQHAKDSVTQSLDWKVQMRKYPIASCIGALAVGYLAGRGLSSRLLKDDDAPTGNISLGGSSLSNQQHKQHIVSPEMRARITGRVENVFFGMAENFLNELTKVGRDVVIPGLIGAVAAKLNTTHNSAETTHKPAAYGGTSHMEQQPSFKGRSI